MQTKTRATTVAVLAALSVAVAGAPAAEARKDTGAYDKSAEKLKKEGCKMWQDIHAADKAAYKKAKKAPFNRKKKVKIAKWNMEGSRIGMEASC